MNTKLRKAWFLLKNHSETCYLSDIMKYALTKIHRCLENSLFSRAICMTYRHISKQCCSVCNINCENVPSWFFFSTFNALHFYRTWTIFRKLSKPIVVAFPGRGLFITWFVDHVVCSSCDLLITWFAHHWYVGIIKQKCSKARYEHQNRRQKIFNRGGFTFVQGAWHSKNWKKSTDS